jgi:peptidoglycan/xylan/chitin deacetylase (PgdA/CDA1 family)
MPPARAALYGATGALIMMSAFAVAVRPPLLFWSSLALAGYASLLVAAVVLLRLRVFVDAVVRGPAGARGVALTFDDGPHPVWTPRVLEILARHGVVGTFFVVGYKVDAHPQVLRAIVEGGHVVALGSQASDRLLCLRTERRVRTDLGDCAAAIERATGERPILFRPPLGFTNPAIARVAEDMDLVLVGWTIAGCDERASARPADVVARVRRGLRDGAIVRLHDSPGKGEREPASLGALPEILQAAHAARLDVVPLTQFVQAVQPRTSAKP